MSPQRFGLFIVLLVGVITPLAAQNGAYWPQWRGPDRTNVSTETGLLKEWAKDGPPLAWKVTNLGTGFAPVSVADGRLYTLAHRDKDEYVVALDRGTGKEIWATAMGPSRDAPYMQFLRQRQPVVDNERVYAFSAGGDLFCLEADGGRILWQKNYAKEFGGRSGGFGWNENPLVDGDRLICTPGVKDAALVALNKRTGEVLWKAATPEPNSAAYSPAVVAEVGGIRQYIQLLSNNLIGVSAKDGKLLWCSERNFVSTANVPTPLVRGDLVFVANWGRSVLLKLSATDEGIKAEEVYTAAFQNVHGGMVLLGDHVYGGHGGWGSSVLTCLELKTGKIAWQQRVPGSSGAMTVLAAEGNLYVRYANGLITLVEATPQGYREKSKFMQPERTTLPAWTHPVLAGGRLYVRDQNVLLCYDLRADRPAVHEQPREKPNAEKEPRQPDAIFVPSPQDVVEKMLELAAVKKEDVVVDLGCGDGRIPVTAAKMFGCNAVGYDIDKECVRLSLENVKKNKVENLVRIEHEDIFKVDLSKADVVCLYLLPRLNVKLIPQLEKLKPGARIVSHAFEMDGVKPDKVITFKSKEDDIERKLYLWTAPLKKEQ
jgi:outer membrane protein assembly factor BamB/precorrin-6B methylase 2